MVLSKLRVFCSDMKFKMAATAGPYGENVSKRFSETTWTIETKLPRNDHWKVLYKIYVFYADRKSKMADTAGHTDPSKCINDHTLRSDTEFCRTSLLKLSDKILPGRSESLHSQIVKL